MLRSEQETIIRWDAEERVAHIWSCDPVIVRKLDGLCEKAPEAYVCVRRGNESAGYDVPMGLITFRIPVSEALRKKRREAALLRNFGEARKGRERTHG